MKKDNVIRLSESFLMANDFIMPAEWKSHEATWLSWPHNTDTFPDNTLEEVREIWLQMIDGLITGEKVHLLVNDIKTEEDVRRRLRKKRIPDKNILIHSVKTEDVWIRDYGPIFVRRKERPELFMTDWIFNAWGNKWPPLENDTRIPKEIEKIIHVPRVAPNMVLEGGSIEVNGNGILMTTEQCLLNPNRNPNLNQKQIEEKLSEYLGADHFIWLHEGIVGDDTDGHIDDIARFVSENTVIAAREKNPNDQNFQPLEENWQRLKSAKDQNGKKLNIVEFPMPGEVPGWKMRAPASYTNFYIGNRAVLVPIYHHPNDKVALKILEDAFPGRNVIGIFCEKLVYGFGAIHCVTQQQPS